MLRLYILGAGTPTPTPARFGTSYVLDVGGGRLAMFDCGPAATYKLVKMGLWPTMVDHLFFTHHHFDHDVDYPCFLLCRWDQSVGRENKLQVIGPKLTEAITERILGENGAFVHDWKARVGHPISQRVYLNRGGKSLPRPPPSVDARDVGPGLVFSGPDWQVTAAAAEHVQPFLDSLAYRIETPEGSVVFTGDTQPCTTVIDLARGVDTMVCMCWNDQDAMDADGETPFQCGTKGAARMAQEAGVKRLVLAHIGPNLSRHPVMEKGIGDVKRIYDGEVVFSEELMALDLPRSGP